MRRLLPVCALVLALLAAPPSAPAATWSHPTRWLVATDVHFTPFLGATPGLIAQLQAAPVRRWAPILRRAGGAPSAYGSDTNAALLASSLAAMRRAVPHPPVVLLAGDLLGHHFQQDYVQLAPAASTADYQRFVDKTIAFLARRFDATFPHAQFVLTLGNNDSYCGDYMATPNSPFLLRTARAWKPLVDRHGRAPGFVASFRRLGSYVARTPIAGLDAVSVDDVFWSANYANACGSPASQPGADQARWLAGAVRGLRAGHRALVLTHIPPGIDVFATLDGSSTSQPVGAPVPLLTTAGQDALLGALDPGRVAALVFGHLHMDTYRLAHGTPMLGAPSISPIYGNNPAFLTATVQRDGTIADYTAHALDLGAARPAWQREFGFRDTYHLPTFDAGALATLHARLAADAGLRSAYSQYYVSGGQDAITEAQYPAYACGSVALDAAAFSSCLAASQLAGA